jgi:AAA+ ATPase superfamily predicted ATPase
LIKPFPDRRHELFGRERQVERLVDRAQSAGLTVVAAPARMGKTWTIEEVARRLSLADNGFMVGYHEAMGGSSQGGCSTR